LSRSCLAPLIYPKASHQFGLERLLHSIAKGVVVILDIPLGKSLFIHSKAANVMGAFGQNNSFCKKEIYDYRQSTARTTKIGDPIAQPHLFPALMQHA
jgi:hypothetical protein